MSRESIEKIREAEARAEQIVENARQEAQRRIAEAERAGQELCETVERESAASLSAAMSQLYKRTATMSDRMDAEAQVVVDKQKEDAALRRRSAEKIVVRGLMSKCR